MDKTVAAILKALNVKRQDQLQSLGDFPKPEAFDHGVQVGIFRGLSEALDVIEAVLNDIAQEDSRR